MSKLTKCKSCGAEIAKSAKACPQCGAKQKPGCLRIVLGTILLFFGLILILAALGGSDEPTPAPDNDTSHQASEHAGAETTDTATDKTFGVGERVEMNNIYVTLNSVTESSGGNYSTPAEGNVFVICELTIENESSGDLAVSSLMSFGAYADDYTVEYSLAGMLGSDKQQLDGTIASGKKMNGIIAFEVPADWSELELHFTPSLYSSRDFVFTYSK